MRAVLPANIRLGGKRQTATNTNRFRPLNDCFKIWGKDFFGKF
jgi:hypothetical protein